MDPTMTKIIKIGGTIRKILKGADVLASVNVDIKIYDLLLFSSRKKWAIKPWNHGGKLKAYY